MIRHAVRVFLFLMVAAVPTVALAQTAPPSPPPASTNSGGIGVGVKAGPLFSSVSEAASHGYRGRTGLIGGLFLGGNRPGIVGVGVDLLYARKGVKEVGGSNTVDLDYLNVPVYLRINAGSSSKNKAIVYGIGGVDLNFLLKAQGPSVNKDDFNSADYGYVVGIGVEVVRVLFEGRYSAGLGTIAKSESAAANNSKNRSFAVMVGVRFH